MKVCKGRKPSTISPSLLIPMLGCPKTTFSFNNLQGLTDLTESLMLTVTVYYNELVKGRDTWGRVQESSTFGVSTYSLPVESQTVITFLTTECDSSHGVLATREALLSFGIQSLYWGSVMQTWMTAHVANLSLQPFQMWS